MPAPLGYSTDLQYAYPGLPIYFNRTDVKQAMHAPMDVERLECKGPVFVGESGPEDEGDSSADQIQHALPKMMEKTNRVLVANGALDFEIITSGTLLAIQNITWNGALGFQASPARTLSSPYQIYSIRTSLPSRASAILITRGVSWACSIMREGSCGRRRF